MFPQSLTKHINKLHQKKYRKEYGEFLLEGVKGVKEAIKNKAEVGIVVIDGKRRDEEDIKEVVELAEKRGVGVEYCGRKDIGEIKTTETFSGVIAVVATPDYELDEVVGEENILVLDEVKDPGNLGTIIRSADWFGVKSIIISENSVDPYNEKVVRSTMGSIFRVKIIESTNIVQDLKTLQEENYKVVSMAMDGVDISKLENKGKTVYVLGSESHGIREEILDMSDTKCTIPGNGEAESLNVAVASSILLYKLNN